MSEWLWVSVKIDEGGPHLAEQRLEDFARKTLPERALEAVEEHLLVCELCRRRLDEIDRFMAGLRAALDALGRFEELHVTAEGPIHLQVWQQEDGAWRAEVHGAGTESTATFKSSEEAAAHTKTIFYEMFPGHTCASGCSRGVRNVA